MGSQKGINKKVLLIVAGTGVLCLGLFGWLAYSDWEKIQSLEEKTQGLKSDITRAEAEIRKIPDLEDEVLVLRERVKEYVTVLPNDTEIHAFVDKLTQFEETAGVSFAELDDSSVRQRQITKGKNKDAFDRVSYKLKLAGNTEQILRFTDLLENQYERFVRIPTLKAAAYDPKGGGSTAKAEPSHDVEMEIETYVYNPKVKGRDQVQIHGEQVKLKKLRETGRLQARSQDLGISRYEYQPNPGRRDPFIDPRQAAGDPGGIVTEAERKAQMETLAALTKKLGSIRETIGQEPNEKNAVKLLMLIESNNNELLSLSREVTRMDEEKFFTVPELAKQFRDEVQTPVKALLDHRPQRPTVVLHRQELEEHVDRMGSALQAQEYAKVISLFEKVKSFESQAANDADMTTLFGRAGEYHLTAKTYIEFAGKNLEFGGSVCYSKDPRQAVVIINSKSYSPGEMVDEGLVITAVTSAEVVFDFRGVKVARRLNVGTGR